VPSPGRNAPTIKEGWRKTAKLDTTSALLFIPDAFLFPEPSQDLADIKRAEQDVDSCPAVREIAG
jgi:hypothetical protein